MFRYVAFVWDASSTEQCEAAAQWGSRLLAVSSDWHSLLNARGLSVFCAGCRPTPSQHYLLANRCGVIVGTLFSRTREFADSAASIPITTFTEADTERIIGSQGRQLVSSCWGRYVAFLLDAAANRCWVIKDPTGGLPCFHTRCGSIHAFFSCMSDCLQIRLQPFTLNWGYIRRRVAASTGRSHETALEEVSEVYGGERVEVYQGKLSRSLLWQPHVIAQSSILEDPAVAAQEMRRTAIACTADWLSGHHQVLHRLSGGLDSSIVLGCARDSRVECDIICVTYHREGGTADERPWARLAVEYARCQHIEHARDPRIDFRKLAHIAPLPRPPDDLSFLELADFERELALDQRATLILSGDGGDAVLGSFSAAYAAEDFLRRHGFKSKLLGIAAAVALWRNISIWHVLGDALRRKYLRRGRDALAGIRDARRLVKEDVYTVAAAERRTNRHPWLEAIDIPSSLSEVLCFTLGSDPFYSPLRPPDEPGVELACPLLSQPFVELCLRIPSYIHFYKGHDRGLARRAFAGAVPERILERHWKDRAPGYTEEILFHGRSYAREMLLDGALVKHGLLDADQIELALSGLSGKSSVSIGEIVDHLVTEAWLRSWIELQAQWSRSTNAW